MLAVILAAGRGKRLHPLTLIRSKPMLPILGKPMVERVLDGLIAQGLRKFLVVVRPQDAELQSHLQKVITPPLEVKLIPQEQPRGTAHALSLAAPYIQEDFLLSACDNLLPEPDLERLLRRWRDHPALDGLLSLFEVPEDQVSATGIVELDGLTITRILEKPSPKEAPTNIASVPVYCFRETLLSHLDDLPLSLRGEYELQAVIQRLIAHGKTVQGLFISRRLTVTTPDDLLAVNLQYLSRLPPPAVRVYSSYIGKNTSFIPPVYVEAGCTIGTDSVIGPQVFLEEGSHLEDGVTLGRSVVLRGARVRKGTTAHNRLFL